jgi:UDP-N-acetylmuramate dehydrogenase
LRVAAGAERLSAIGHLAELTTLNFDPESDLILGDGSNVLLASDVPGTVWLNRIMGRRIGASKHDQVSVSVGAGEPWHDVVRWTLEEGLSGLENLSLIPGRCGAAPLQNIGAYGVELAEHLEAVEAWNWETGTLQRIPRDECGFAYRDSRFKSQEPDRWLITTLHLSLDLRFNPRLEYQGLRDALADAPLTAKNVSDAVIRLRRAKLPDPERIGNAGSFFKNPVLSSIEAQQLRDVAPSAPLHATGTGQFKTSAAWLIEACGWKGRRIGDAGVSDRHALVLVNYGSATGEDLLDLAEQVRADVWERFRICLEAEPRIVDFRR